MVSREEVLVCRSYLLLRGHEMKLNVRLALLFLAVSFILTLVISLTGRKPPPHSARIQPDWKVEIKAPTNKVQGVDYSGLRERNFQMLPRKERERLRGQPEEVKTEQVVKQIDKTLRPSFIEFNERSQLGLVGLFNEENAFAVFQQIDFETKQSTFLKVRVGDAIGAYKLQQVTPKFAKLESPEHSITMNIFKQK